MSHQHCHGHSHQHNSNNTPWLYEQYYRLLDVKNELPASTSIADKPERLLKLFKLNYELYDAHLSTLSGIKNRASKASMWTSFFTAATLVGTVFFQFTRPELGLASKVFASMVLGAMAGGILTYPLHFLFKPILSPMRFGCSDKEKEVIQSSLTLKDELQPKVDREISATLKSMTNQDIAASPHKDSLFSKLPHLAFEFKKAQLPETTRPVAPAQPAAPTPKAEKPASLVLKYNQ